MDTYDAKIPPFVLICTNVELDPVTVMTYYEYRWDIEAEYRHLKDAQGFDQYQVRSLGAIKRLWEIRFLMYTYLEFQRHHHRLKTTGEVVRREQRAFVARLVVYGYLRGRADIPINEVSQRSNIDINEDLHID